MFYVKTSKVNECRILNRRILASKRKQPENSKLVSAFCKNNNKLEFREGKQAHVFGLSDICRFEYVLQYLLSSDMLLLNTW